MSVGPYIRDQIRTAIQQAEVAGTPQSKHIAKLLRLACARIDALEDQLATKTTLRDEMAMRFVPSLLLKMPPQHHDDEGVAMSDVIKHAYQLADLALIKRIQE